MNKLETAYAEELERRKLIGEVADYRFEELKLRLAKRTYLTVDFFVMLADGTLEAHECKGFMEDDAAVKLKVAAEKFWWFKFYLVQARRKRDGGGFTVTEIR